MIVVIAAVAENGVIGRDNQLPWRLPADLKRFKTLTLGNTLVMGRRTFESIGRPLPGRTSVVVTRDRTYAPSGVVIAHSLDEALARPGQLFVAGGAQLYAAALERADRLELTRIERPFEGDALFPAFDLDAWRLVWHEHHGAGPEGFGYRFLTYERIR
jgi:dihydrofolate reductase